MKDFKDFLYEKENVDKIIGRQNSYGQHLKEAFSHMNKNILMYCKENNISYEDSRFEITVNIVKEVNATASKDEEKKEEK